MRGEHSSVVGGESRRRWVLVVALLAASLLLVAIPAGAAPSGDVEATVTVEGPCVSVSATAVDFGAVGFSQSATNTEDTAGSFTVTNCSSQQQDMYGAATDATGDVAGSWTLNEWDESALACTWGPDNFGAGLTQVGNSAEWWLSSTADTFMYVEAAASIGTIVPHVLMPCTGSSGVGETMTFSYTITGVLP